MCGMLFLTGASLALPGAAAGTTGKAAFITKNLKHIDAVASSTIGTYAAYQDTGDIKWSLGVGGAIGASCYFRSLPKEQLLL